MSYKSNLELINRFATHLTDLGFTVYVSKTGMAGCYTDNTGDRVVSFQTQFGDIKLSGNYKPSRHSGSGWDLGLADPSWSKESLQKYLQYNAPLKANPAPEYLNIKQYLELYPASYEGVQKFK